MPLGCARCAGSQRGRAGARRLPSGSRVEHQQAHRLRTSTAHVSEGVARWGGADRRQALSPAQEHQGLCARAWGWARRLACGRRRSHDGLGSSPWMCDTRRLDVLRTPERAAPQAFSEAQEPLGASAGGAEGISGTAGVGAGPGQAQTASGGRPGERGFLQVPRRPARADLFAGSSPPKIASWAYFTLTVRRGQLVIIEKLESHAGGLGGSSLRGHLPEMGHHGMPGQQL